VIQFLLVKYVSAIDIHYKLMEVYGDGIMRVQHVEKRCKESENGQAYIHGGECTCWPSTSRMDMNTV
jgi:hypothetical protein